MKVRYSEKEYYKEYYKLYKEIGDPKIEIYEREGENEKVYGAAFFGKSTKPAWHYVFNSREEMINYSHEWIDSKIKNYVYWENLKKQKKETRAKEIEVIKEGDILYNSWGYDQTNIDYYLVVGKKNKIFFIRELAQKREYTGYMSGNCVPDKEKFADEKIIKKLTFNMEVGYLSKWDGRPLGFSEYA